MASGKFLQSIHVGNKDILHTAILEFDHYLQPELAILGLAIRRDAMMKNTNQYSAISSIPWSMAMG